MKRLFKDEAFALCAATLFLAAGTRGASRRHTPLAER